MSPGPGAFPCPVAAACFLWGVPFKPAGEGWTKQGDARALEADPVLAPARARALSRGRSAPRPPPPAEGPSPGPLAEVYQDRVPGDCSSSSPTRLFS